MIRHSLLRNNIASFRSKLGLNQTQFGNLVGVSKNTISSLERGEFFPTAYLAALICKACSCKFEDLFYLEEF